MTARIQWSLAKTLIGMIMRSYSCKIDFAVQLLTFSYENVPVDVILVYQYVLAK